MTESALPYPPSIFDRVFHKAAGEKWRKWLYAGVFALAAIVSAIAFYVDGTLALDTTTTILINSLWVIALFAAIEFVDAETQRAALRFEELFRGSADEYKDEVYRLTTMPARPAAIVWWVAFMLFLWLGTWFQEVGDFDSIGVRAIQAPVLAFGYASGVLFAYHSVRLLRNIRRVLGAALVNIFHLQPMYGFANVTSKVALIFIGIQAFNAVSELLPNGGGLNSEFWIGGAITSVLALIAFFGPLQQTHSRIVVEKALALSANSTHIEKVRSSMYRALEDDDLPSFTGFDGALHGLLRMAETVNGVSPWPWSKGAFRAFFTAVSAPIVVWTIQQVLSSYVER